MRSVSAFKALHDSEEQSATELKKLSAAELQKQANPEVVAWKEMPTAKKVVSKNGSKKQDG